MAALAHATINPIGAISTMTPVANTRSFGIARRQSTSLPIIDLNSAWMNPATRNVGRIVPMSGVFVVSTGGTTKTGPSFYWK